MRKFLYWILVIASAVITAVVGNLLSNNSNIWMYIMGAVHGTFCNIACSILMEDE